MSNLERLTITLTAELVEEVKGAIEAGDYASSSEVVREALRDWRDKRSVRERQLAELKADIRAGLDDVAAGRVEDFDAESIVDEGRRRLATRSSLS